MTNLRADNIDVAVLRRLLAYDAVNGELRWKIGVTGSGRRQRAGDIAGCLKSTGYRDVRIGGKPYKAHRVAWAIYYGEWPETFLDHVNGIRDDNRIANLRIATRAQNNQNATRKARALPRGVHPNGSGFTARINVDGQGLCLGTFCTPEEAHAVYCAAARKHHGKFARLK